MTWSSWSASFLFAAVLGATALADAVSTTANPAIYQYICPAGMDLVNGECRGFVEKIESTYNEIAAKQSEICSTLNGYPPIIHNSEENEYWHKYPYITSNSLAAMVIGIICNVSSKTWIWADGSRIDYKPSSYDADLDRPCDSNGGWYLARGEPSSLKWYHYFSSDSHAFEIHCITELKKPEIREDDCLHFENSDSKCYQVSDNVQLWSDAQNACKRVGANLASIHSDQENSFIRRLAVSRGYIDGLMLGATIAGKGNNFAWIDGTEWNYTHFVPGFPIDGFGDCLVMDTADTNGLWANTDCSTKLPFVCERKQFTSSPHDSCMGGNIKEGDIVRTPGFPADANTFCDFFLKVETAKLVEIEILLLEANTNSDHFVLYEGSFGGNIIANLTGAFSGAKYRTTSSSVMKASWMPNGAKNVRGAAFTFKGV